MGVTVFYIAFMLNLVCIGGYIYRYVKLNDKRKDSLLALGTLGVSEIVALTLMPTMMTLSKIITTIDGINMVHPVYGILALQRLLSQPIQLV